MKRTYLGLLGGSKEEGLLSTVSLLYDKFGGMCSE